MNKFFSKEKMFKEIHNSEEIVDVQMTFKKKNFSTGMPLIFACQALEWSLQDATLLTMT